MGGVRHHHNTAPPTQAWGGVSSLSEIIGEHFAKDTNDWEVVRLCNYMHRIARAHPHLSTVTRESVLVVKAHKLMNVTRLSGDPHTTELPSLQHSLLH